MRTFRRPLCHLSIRNSIVAIACLGMALPAVAEVIEVKLGPGVTLEKRLILQPGKFAELCADLKSGQTVAWRFNAAASTDFNIHYHVGKQVEYPERREGVSNASGRLVVGSDQGYCWMWINRSAVPIALDVALSDTGG